MNTLPPDEPDSARRLRVVAIDEPGGPIPGRPHIALARQLHPEQAQRIALVSSGLFDELNGAVLPVPTAAKPALRLVRPEAGVPPSAGDQRSATLKMGRRRRRSTGATDDPEGAA